MEKINRIINLQSTMDISKVRLCFCTRRAIIGLGSNIEEYKETGRVLNAFSPAVAQHLTAATGLPIKVVSSFDDVECLPARKCGWGYKHLLTPLYHLLLELYDPTKEIKTQIAEIVLNNPSLSTSAFEIDDTNDQTTRATQTYYKEITRTKNPQLKQILAKLRKSCQRNDQLHAIFLDDDDNNCNAITSISATDLPPNTSLTSFKYIAANKTNPELMQTVAKQALPDFANQAHEAMSNDEISLKPTYPKTYHALYDKAISEDRDPLAVLLQDHSGTDTPKRDSSFPLLNILSSVKQSLKNRPAAPKIKQLLNEYYRALNETDPEKKKSFSQITHTLYQRAKVISEHYPSDLSLKKRLNFIDDISFDLLIPYDSSNSSTSSHSSDAAQLLIERRHSI